MGSSDAYSALFEPDRLDSLEEISAGKTARILRAGSLAIKLPHPFDRFRRLVDREAAVLRQLGRPDFQPRVPAPTLHFAEKSLGIVRDFVEGASILSLLQEGDGTLPDRIWEAAWATFVATESYRKKTKTVLDFSPPNLIYEATSNRVTLVDLGARLEPSPFVNLEADELRGALGEYATSHPAQDEREIRRLFFPPSGRFSVGVPVGRNRPARLIWRNRRMLERWNLNWSDEDLKEIGDWSTENEPFTDWFEASRYQDSRGTSESDAQGDGRSIYVGTVPRGAYAAAEVMLKGVGPTPLAWRGMMYHSDGRVSFNRTLWETSISDELARLGFETPEVAAVLLSDSTTIDNSEAELPAGIAIRVASTHFRLGHLMRHRDDRGAFVTLLDRAGRQILRPDFDPEEPADREALVENFAKNLGRNAGRTECLNIVAFNPTPGNIRVDGHLVDFSTVRFFDRTLPDFRFMEMSWNVAHHRWVLRRQVRRLIDCLAEGIEIGPQERRDLILRSSEVFEESDALGYLEELFRLLGIGRAPAKEGKQRAHERKLLRLTRELRALRDSSGRKIHLQLWKQQVPAPLFRLETQLPAFIAGDRLGDLLLDPERDADPSETEKELLDRFVRASATVFCEDQDPSPLRWDERIRPFMEAERLARLVYRETTPDHITRWADQLETW